ncbi:hypothetical protein [Acinetobacter portensis]|uniref:hypothetical protein n=1 Tax=Acinetobacter portensis TaxID=1839785 RepID=UPI0013D4EE59|nr:hypothetical protein [Acinetobacter portensis]
MNRTILFKIFCFCASFLLLSNMIVDFKSEQIPYVNILIQFGLILLLIDLGFNAKEELKNQEDDIQIKSSSKYRYLMSKIGLSTSIIGFLIQSLSI